MDDLQPISTVWRVLALCRRPESARVTGPGHSNGGWSPEAAAAELHRRRAELIGQLRRRSDGRGVPPTAQEEIVDDAITAVVMSPRGIRNERHMLGGFWVAVENRCNRYREGRHFTRLGSRMRVEFDATSQQATLSANPYETLELRDRFARAADLMAELDPRECQVVSVMACYGVGPVPAARLLGLPLGEVRSAVRSANAKLDRVAAIAAAGRMCQFRERVIAADAAGEANEYDARLAQAHVTACVPCGRVYRRLRREMRGREFQRAAAAAFLPMPAAPLGHATALGKLAVWIEQRVPFLPRGSGGRAAEVLGGAGVAKVAIAGTALVAATASIATHTFQSPTPAHHHHHRLARATTAGPAAIATSTPGRNSSVSAVAASSTLGRAASPPTHGKLPSSAKRLPRRLRYLAIGDNALPRSQAAVAVAASVKTSRQAPSTAATSAPIPPAGSTGSVHSGTNQRYSYLGHQ